MLSKFHSRYPFALGRGPSARELVSIDPNNPRGHEPETAHLLDLLVPDDGVFVDVGANVGYFSIFLATRPGFRGTIHAFEPVERTFIGLRRLIRSLQCDNTITCHKLAVSDRNGTAIMEVEGLESGLARIVDKKLEHGETVQTTTLDSLDLEKVDFLKIKAGKFEGNVLRGAEALIRASMPFIHFESWTFEMHPEKVFEPLQFLLARGYQLYLPGWAQSTGLFHVGTGASHEMDTFALVPFSMMDRLTFPGNPVDHPICIFASPRSREHSLGVSWSTIPVDTC